MSHFDDKITTKQLQSFFEQAFQSRAKTKEDLQKIADGFGMRMRHGKTFFIDREMSKVQNETASTIVEKMGSELGHHGEVLDVLWDVAAEKFSDKQPKFPDVIAECISRLDEFVTSPTQYIHPAYNVSLSDDVKEIELGPIKISDGFATVSNLSELHDNLEFGFEAPAGLLRTGKNICYNVGETMWEIELRTSKAAQKEQAIWLTCIATTLIRIILGNKDIGHLFPHLGDIENKPFEAHKLSDEHISVKSDGSLGFGGSKVGRYYKLGKEAQMTFDRKEVREKLKLVFFPPSKSLAARFAQGSGWLAKGRQSNDRAERFLFFFTALEALLSLDDRTSPVVQTIARHASVLWTNDITGRINMSQRIRTLYSTRSAMVHAGSRKVSYERVNEIQKIAETVFFAVWETADLSVRHGGFCDELSKASYGIPYFEE